MRYKKGSLRLVGVLTLTVVVLAACSSSKPSTSSSNTGSTAPAGSAGTSAGSTGTSGGGTSGNTASAPGVTADSISVGFLYDATGAASSTFKAGLGAAQAVIAAQNAQGGVNGRQIKLVTADTTSSPAGDLTASQELVQSKGVFAIITDSALVFGSTSYLQGAGIPVVGQGIDGPEWYTQPNTNMFTTLGNSSPAQPAYTTTGQFWKSLGATKVSLGASNTPSSTRGVNDDVASLKAANIQTCADTVFPLGGVNFTAFALSVKQAGCQGAECSCVLSSSLAMSTALKQQGLNVPVTALAGPDPGVYANSQTENAATGVYFPFALTLNSPAWNQMISNLKQYDSAGYSSGIPNQGIIGSTEAATLFIKGLQVAGQNPTRQSYITNLRQVSGWDANGLLANPISFANFGQSNPQQCSLWLKFDGKNYNPYPASGPICGTLIPGTDQPVAKS